MFKKRYTNSNKGSTSKFTWRTIKLGGGYGRRLVRGRGKRNSILYNDNYDTRNGRIF